MNDKIKRWHGVGHDNTPQNFVTMLASDYDALAAELAQERSDTG